MLYILMLCVHCVYYSIYISIYIYIYIYMQHTVYTINIIQLIKNVI